MTFEGQTFLLFRRPSNLSTAAAASMMLMPPSPPTAAFPADRRLSVFAPEAQIRLNRGTAPIPQGGSLRKQSGSLGGGERLSYMTSTKFWEILFVSHHPVHIINQLFVSEFEVFLDTFSAFPRELHIWKPICLEIVHALETNRTLD